MNATPSSSEQTAHFISLLKKFHTAVLVTHQGEHGLHSRPMAIAKVEDDGRVWFFTGANSGKVHEIAADAEVHLVAQDGDSAFLSLNGRATLSTDPAKISELWQEPFRVWFPDGKDDPNIELIAVQPERGEFWDNSGVNRFSYLWDAAKAYVTGTTPEVHADGDLHASVRL